ncbi:hypothetical protein [Bradyrhizobium sp. F1.13.3]|uniref:hypothetical protein n=1 Tax=Bradyrhizobium sp. F1.13.3 TaxID=3156351 RepID=UPI003399496B
MQQQAQVSQRENRPKQQDRYWLTMPSPDRIHLFNEYAMTLPDNLTTRQVQAAMLKRFPIW